MSFSVAVWNMQRRAGWDYLERVLAADIALLQEVAPTSARRPGLLKQIGGSRRWGSAVVSPHPLTELHEVKNRYTRGAVTLIRQNPGAVVAVRIEVPGEQPLVAVSLYGLIDDGYAVTSVHRALSDLTPLMDSSLRHRVIIGGDLNCSSQLPAPDRARHRNLFERFHTLGLVDLTGLTAASRPPQENCPCEDDPCRHVQTFRREGSAPYQDDWLFASERLANRVYSVVVHNHPDSEAWLYSDHAPVRAVFG